MYNNINYLFILTIAIISIIIYQHFNDMYINNNTVTTSSTITTHKQNIYVYNDEGASIALVQHLLYSINNIVNNNNHNNYNDYNNIIYNVTTITAYDIIHQPWEDNTVLLVMPGGRDLPYVEKLYNNNNDNNNNLITGSERILKYIENGGSYIGICAGAYFSCNYIEFGKNTSIEVIGYRPLKLYPYNCIGPLYNDFIYNSEYGTHAQYIEIIDNTLLQNNNNNKQEINEYIATYINGGGVFVTDQLVNNNNENITILANYIDKYNTIHDNYNINKNISLSNSAAIVEIQYGKGKVLLSHVHIEISPILYGSDIIDTVRDILVENEQQRNLLWNALVLRMLK